MTTGSDHGTLPARIVGTITLLACALGVAAHLIAPAVGLIEGVTMWSILVLAILLGLIPAAIARGKGRDFVLWWLYGAALLIVALPHALLLMPDREGIEHQQLSEGLRKCPFCAEMIKHEAVKCRFCGSEVPAPAPTDAPGVVQCLGCAKYIKPSRKDTTCYLCGAALPRQRAGL